MTFWVRWRFRKEWNEADHPRGKTTPESNSGSFAPAAGQMALDFNEINQQTELDFDPPAEPHDANMDLGPLLRELDQASKPAEKNPAVSWYKVRDKVEPGAILVSSWGYDQTNIDYYEVVKLTSSGKSAIVRPMSKVTADTKNWTVAPDQKGYGKGKGTMTKRILGAKADGKNLYERGHIKITDYQRAYLWDGKPDYETPPGFGH